MLTIGKIIAAELTSKPFSYKMWNR